MLSAKATISPRSFVFSSVVTKLRVLRGRINMRVEGRYFDQMPYLEA